MRGRGVAAERYRLRNGRWPAALADIPPVILPAVPLDPFDGKPLRYAPRPDGVIVYSVGVDGRDNGGAESGSFPSNELLAHPWLYSHGTDLVFRLYDPAKRGLPPLERKPEAGEVPEPADPKDPVPLPEPREVGSK